VKEGEEECSKGPFCLDNRIPSQLFGKGKMKTATTFRSWVSYDDLLAEEKRGKRNWELNSKAGFMLLQGKASSVGEVARAGKGRKGRGANWFRSATDAADSSDHITESRKEREGSIGQAPEDSN